MSEENSNYFFTVLPSNVKDYPENKTSKFRVHLPKPIRFQGSWLVGLYSIQYPRSFTTTSGTVEDQYIDLHRSDGRVQRLSLPKASLNTIEGLQNYINGNVQDQLLLARRRFKKDAQSEEASEPQDEILETTADKIPGSPSKRKRPHNYGIVHDDVNFVCRRIGKRYVCTRKRPFVEEMEDQERTNEDEKLAENSGSPEALPLTRGQRLKQLMKGRTETKHDETTEAKKDENKQEQAQSTTESVPPPASDTKKDETKAKEAPAPATPLTKGQKLKQMVKQAKHPEQAKEDEKKKKAEAPPAVEDAEKTKEKQADQPEKTENKEEKVAQSTQVPPKTKGQQLIERLKQAKQPVQPKDDEKKAEGSLPAQEPQKTEAKQTDQPKEDEKKAEAPPPAKTEGPQKTMGQQLKELVKQAKQPEEPKEEEKKKEEVEPVAEPSAPKSPEKEKAAEKAALPDKTKTHGDLLLDLLEKKKVEKPSVDKTNADKLLETLREGDTTTNADRLWELLRGADDHPVDEILIGTGSAEHGVRFHYRKDIDRFWVEIDDPDLDFISLSSQIAYVLGFAERGHIGRDEIAKYAADLKGGYNSFAIYATGLTRSVILGNSLSSLLRIVAVEGDYGNTIEKIYDHPMFIPVLPREINELEIELRFLDGNFVPFEFGHVLVTLVFKKVINF